MKTLSAALLASTVTLMAGCSTPQPVRDVAQRGAATVALAETSLREYIAISNAQLSARMDLIQHDTQDLAADNARRELDKLFDQSAGITADDAIEKKIRELVTERRRIREKQAAALAQIELATQLDPALLGQVPADKLAEAKKGFAVLSEELSAVEWISLAAEYAKQISADIDTLTKEEKGQ